MPTLAKTRVWWLGRIGARLDGLRAQKQVIGGFPVGTAFRGSVLAAEAGLLSTLDELVPEARLAIPELDRLLATRPKADYRLPEQTLVLNGRSERGWRAGWAAGLAEVTCWRD